MWTVDSAIYGQILQHGEALKAEEEDAEPPQGDIKRDLPDETNLSSNLPVRYLI